MTLPGPPAHCPRCGAGPLRAIGAGDQVNFLCSACSRCWHVELGRIARVPPHTCAGCDAASACRSAWDADHPG